MDKVSIDAGTTFGIMDGVSAEDYVDGDVTHNITTNMTTVNLDTSKAGIFEITYSVSDTAGQTTTHIRKVHIRPVITVTPLNGPIAVKGGDTFNTKTGVTVTQYSDGSTPTLTASQDTISLNTEGTYSITYSITDKSDNVTIENTRLVNVTDQTGPVIVFDPDPNVLELSVSQQYLPGAVIQNKLYIENKLRAGVTCHDYVDKIIPIFQIDKGPLFDMSIAGDHIVTYTAKDSKGNITERTRTLRVTYSGGDPYVYPLIGSCYKLPNCEDIYRLYQDDDAVINAMVSVATPQIQDEIVRAVGRTSDFLNPIASEAYFYSKILVASRTTDDHVIIDLTTKQHMCSNTTSMFKVELPMVSIDCRPYEDQNASYVCIPIIWGDDKCLNISFSRNAQIRNGVRLSGSDLEHGTGLLIRNYRPKFFRLSDIHNKVDVKIPNNCRRPLTKRGLTSHREIKMTNVR